MKSIIVILSILLCLNAQASKPLAERCDTIIYYADHKTYAIYKYRDGSAWVQDTRGKEYMSKRRFRKWKKEHIKI